MLCRFHVGRLHTVALPRARSGPDFPRDAPDHDRDRGAGAGGDGAMPSITDVGTPPETPTSSAQAFLRQFDTQMESAIIDMDKVRQTSFFFDQKTTT